MKYDLVIFDMDGTTLFTLPDIVSAINRTLKAYGYPERSMEDVRKGIGHGGYYLVKMMLPEGTPEDIYRSVRADFTKDYGMRFDEETVPYEGMPELMQALRGEGIHIASNSNKVDESVAKLGDHHFPGMIEMHVGEQEGLPNKPSPEGVKRILAHFSVTADRAVYVGDGDTDILTARNAGIDAIWVTWGFRKPGEIDVPQDVHICDSIGELRKYLLS